MTDPRPDLADIRTRYQVADDEVITYRPRVFGAIDIPFTDGREMTRTEGALLDRLTRDRGLVGLSGFRDIAREAFAEGERRFPDNPLPAGIPADRAREWQGNDGHRDAFRHAYWSARLAQEYGPDWARAFTTAHEGLPGNFANREAMDLYNNNVGVRIGAANRNASPEELSRLISGALDRGELVAMDARGQLEWSDRVRVGQHGLTPTDVIGPHLPTPGAVSTDSRVSAVTPQPGEACTAVADADVERMRQDPLYQQVLAAMRTRGLDGDQLAANLYAGARAQNFTAVADLQLGNPVTTADGRADRNIFLFDGSRNPVGQNYVAVSENRAQATPERDAAVLALQVPSATAQVDDPVQRKAPLMQA